MLEQYRKVRRMGETAVADIDDDLDESLELDACAVEWIQSISALDDPERQMAELLHLLRDIQDMVEQSPFEEYVNASIEAIEGRAKAYDRGWSESQYCLAERIGQELVEAREDDDKERVVVLDALVDALKQLQA